MYDHPKLAPRVGLFLVLCGAFSALACGAPPSEPEEKCTTTGACPPDDPADLKPVRVHAVLNRMPAAFSEAEIREIPRRFDLVSGLDGHGEYPSTTYAATLRQERADLPVLCFSTASDIQPSKPEFAGLDAHEDLFLHSGNPASLRIGRAAAGDLLWFRRDRRAARDGAQGYVVEKAASAAGPWASVGSLVLDTTEELYRVTVPAAEAAGATHYRISTRRLDGTDAVYSGPTPVSDLGTLHLTAAAVDLSAVPGADEVELTARVRCYGADCPSAPAQLHFVVDFNSDRAYAAAVCNGLTDLQSGCERIPFTSAQADSTLGGTLYSLQIQIPLVPAGARRSYRVELASSSAVAAQPGNESWQLHGYNNRLMIPTFASHLVNAADERWIGMQRERLSACTSRGYTGMRLDFAFGTLWDAWMSSGLPPDWRPGDTRVRDAALALIDALKTHAPEAQLSFNGSFMSGGAFDDYVAVSDGGEVEYFAYSVDSAGQTVRSSTAATVAGLQAVLRAASTGKWVSALAAGSPDDVSARLSSLALYLLVVSENTFFYYSTDTGYQGFEHYPEWEVPIGQPVTKPASLAELADPAHPGLLVRHFTHGVVYVNSSSDSVSVSLERRAGRLSVTPGRSPAAGGASVMSTHVVEVVSLAPQESAILLYLGE